jgi:hypothetical protein
MSGAKMPEPMIHEEKTFGKVTRRELLKVAPLLAVGSIAFPSSLLKN